MRTRVVIQSRLNSSRLPGKALLTLAGMPLIELVARRVSRSGHEVVVATSDDHYDQRIADHLTRVGIPVVRGSLDDVLARFVAATADLADDDTVVRMTGDNPLADADLIDELAAATATTGRVYGRNNVDLAPEGIGCECLPVGLLRRAHREATDPYDREHVTPWIRRAVPELDHVPQRAPSDIVRYRATVDCLDDYDVMSRVFDGVDDPVGARWPDLMDRVGQCRPGPMVPRAEDGLHGMAAVVLQIDPHEPAPELRERLRLAVGHGVGHVLGPVAAAPTLRAAGDPAVRQRIEHLLQLPTDLPESALEATVLRTAAGLGGQRLGAVIHPGVPTSPQWARLEALRAEGIVGELGVRLGSADELDRLPGGRVPTWLVADGGLAAGLATLPLAERLGRTRIVVTGEAELPPYGIAARAVTSVP